jgi:hypothetical protein
MTGGGSRPRPRRLLMPDSSGRCQPLSQVVAGEGLLPVAYWNSALLPVVMAMGRRGG